MKDPRKNLRAVLKANAAFSSASGIVLIIAKQPIAELMHIKYPEILMYIGIGLLAFAVSLVFTAIKSTLSVPQVKMIIWQDWAWVIGSTVIVAFQLFEMSTIAYVLVTVVALLVGLFAVLQAKHLKQL